MICCPFLYWELKAAPEKNRVLTFTLPNCDNLKDDMVKPPNHKSIKN
jgi:hypothetical protein